MVPLAVDDTRGTSGSIGEEASVLGDDEGGWWVAEAEASLCDDWSPSWLWVVGASVGCGAADFVLLSWSSWGSLGCSVDPSVFVAVMLPAETVLLMGRGLPLE